jgi:hypothetical protein
MMRQVALTASECRGDPAARPVPSDGEAATRLGGENVSVRLEGPAAGGSRWSTHAWDRFHDGGVSALVTLLTCCATVVLVLTAGSALDAVRAERAVAAAYLAIALGLGLVHVEVYGRGTVSVGAIGLLAIGIALGPGPAAYGAVLVAAAAWLQLGGRPQRAMFNASALAIAAAAGAEIYALVASAGDSVLLRSAAGLAAGTVFWLLNIGLLTARDGVFGEPLAGHGLERALPLVDAVLPRLRAARAPLGAGGGRRRRPRPGRVHAPPGRARALHAPVPRAAARVGGGDPRRQRAARDRAAS